MAPRTLMRLAIDVADQGMSAGELPIGAAVVMGEEAVGRAYAGKGRKGVGWSTLTCWPADPAVGSAAGLAAGIARRRRREHRQRLAARRP